MIRRVVPFFTARIRQNYRLLNSSASALSQPQSQSQSQVEATDSVVMTENCVRVSFNIYLRPKLPLFFMLKKCLC